MAQLALLKVDTETRNLSGLLLTRRSEEPIESSNLITSRQSDALCERLQMQERPALVKALQSVI